MSRIIPTKLGRFNAVKDGTETQFLFECPDCGEWLPMSEEHLNGSTPIDHQSLKVPATFCTFSGTREFGSALISRMQAHILVDGKSFDEDQTL